MLLQTIAQLLQNTQKMTYYPHKIFKINLNEFIRWIILRVQTINLFMTSIKNLTLKNIFRVARFTVLMDVIERKIQ